MSDAHWIDGDLLTPANLNLKASRALGYYNILDYDADPTGATDSAAAINAALSACGLAGGGVVYTPPGTFLFNSQIAHTRDNVMLLGAGMSSIWQSGVTSGTAIYINNNTAGGSVINGFHMAHMYIYGSGSESILLRVDYALEGSLFNVKIFGSGNTGLHLGRAQNISVLACNIRSNKGWGVIFGNDGQGNAGQTGRILYSTIKGNGTTTVGTGGIFLQSGGEHIVNGNQIESHDFDANCRGVLVFADTSIIDGNIFESNNVVIEVGSVDGLYGQTSDRIRTQCVIINNRSNNGVPNEVRLVNGSLNIIKDNKFSNSTVVVDETNNKYQRLDGYSSNSLTSNVTDGKVVSLIDGIDATTAALQRTFTDQDATPDVMGITAFRTDNTLATTITDFDGSHTGKIFFIRIGDANTTIANNAAIFTGTGANLTPASGDVLVLSSLAGTGATNQPVHRVIGFMSTTADIAAAAGTITVASGSANNATTTGWHEVAPDRWVPYITDPTP